MVHFAKFSDSTIRFSISSHIRPFLILIDLERPFHFNLVFRDYTFYSFAVERGDGQDVLYSMPG
jgi:hypothetical protein